jgi:hypothetical protein
MKELVDFQFRRIEALDKRVKELERYVLELSDEDCPEDYRRIVRSEILNKPIAD